MSSNWFRHLVNAHTSPSERRLKYRVLRVHGLNEATARRLRDWRWNKIARRLGYADVQDLLIICALDYEDYLQRLAVYEGEAEAAS